MSMMTATENELVMAIRLRRASFTLRNLLLSCRRAAFLLALLAPAAAAATTSCPSWDVQKYCCPSACTARSFSAPLTADKMLQTCMAGLGCSADESSHASVFQMCRCP